MCAVGHIVCRTCRKKITAKGATLQIQVKLEICGCIRLFYICISCWSHCNYCDWLLAHLYMCTLLCCRGNLVRAFASVTYTQAQQAEITDKGLSRWSPLPLFYPPSLFPSLWDDLLTVPINWSRFYWGFKKNILTKPNLMKRNKNGKKQTIVSGQTFHTFFFCLFVNLCFFCQHTAWWLCKESYRKPEHLVFEGIPEVPAPWRND